MTDPLLRAHMIAECSERIGEAIRRGDWDAATAHASEFRALRDHAWQMAYTFLEQHREQFAREYPGKTLALDADTLAFNLGEEHFDAAGTRVSGLDAAMRLFEPAPVQGRPIIAVTFPR